MPFTVSHAAVALMLPPRARGLIVPSALIAGAMAPDLVYYVGALPVLSADATHSPAGAVTVDALLAVAMVVLWRMTMRVPLLSLLPQPWRQHALRQTHDLRPGLGRPALYAAVFASAALGALSHIAVDLFTHERATTPSFLAGRTLGRFEVTWLLQVGLSALGLAALAWWLGRWWTGVPRAGGQAVQWPRSAYLVAAATGTVALAVAAMRADAVWGSGARVVLVQWTFGAATGAAIAVLAWCLVWNLRHPGNDRLT